MILKILGLIAIGILAIMVVATIYFLCVHTGKIREYRDEKGNVLPNSISEKIKIQINGAENGLFINGKNKDNPVLLLISSGPGTDDYFLNEKYPDTHIEDQFTVCYWDYRGMGIVYDENIDPGTITEDVLVNDAVAVTEYLKERFNKEKIYLLAFSGGTRIAIPLVTQHPDLYYAYIGMAQLVCSGEENDTLMYEFMKNVFTERNDTKRLKKLDTLVEFKDNGMVECYDWYDYVMLLHEAGGGTTMNETELIGIDIPILKAHCYTVKESFDYIRGMKMYRKTTFSLEEKVNDYRVSHNNFALPMYFLSGDHDFNCPWPLVEEYCNLIDAPKKNFYLVENAAHSPLWEQQEICYNILADIISATGGK